MQRCKPRKDGLHQAHQTSRSDEVRRTAGRRLAYRSETEEGLRDGRRHSRLLECRAARQHRRGWQRRWSRTLRVRTGWVAVRAVLMSGVIRRHVYVVVAYRHSAGGHRADRHVEIAKHKRQISIDRRQHKSGRNQFTQEQKAEDEHSGPAWFLNVAHPFHDGLIP